MSIASLIPMPNSLKRIEGSFHLDSNCKIQFRHAAARDSAYLLRNYIRKTAGFTPEFVSELSASADIVLELPPSFVADPDTTFPLENYRLEITPERIRIGAQTDYGLARGIETLRQLLPAQESSHITLECCIIEDGPVFQWRGMHLDVSRHFFDVATVLRLIDQLALYKINVLHWHLTDDQGWRLEIRKYPRLTEVGAHRAESLVGDFFQKPRRFDHIPYGGYYTQAEIREIVEYARKRRILIVPEIDMPGHMQAAVAAYPEIGNFPENHWEVRCLWGVSSHILFPGEKTIAFICDILDEVFELFPSPFVHLGGDEADKSEWNECRRLQELMQEKGVANEQEMQRHFICEVSRFCAARGRTVIGWDEIAEGGLSPEAAIISWRDPAQGIPALKNGFTVINADANFTYFDYFQGPPEQEPPAIGGNLPLEKVYQFTPVPEGCEDSAAHVLGGQGQLWTEYIADQAHLDYMLFPRLTALAEKLWKPAADCSWEEFRKRLDVHLARLDAMQVNYRNPEKDTQ